MNLLRGKSYHWHAAVGAGVSVVAAFGHVVPWFTVFAVGLAGFLHELGDGCFDPRSGKDGAPWSGVLDTLAFMVVPIAVALVAWVRGS